MLPRRNELYKDTCRLKIKGWKIYTMLTLKIEKVE